MDQPQLTHRINHHFIHQHKTSVLSCPAPGDICILEKEPKKEVMMLESLSNCFRSCISESVPVSEPQFPHKATFVV